MDSMKPSDAETLPPAVESALGLDDIVSSPTQAADTPETASTTAAVEELFEEVIDEDVALFIPPTTADEEPEVVKDLFPPNAVQTNSYRGQTGTGSPDTIQIPTGNSEQVGASLNRLPNIDFEKASSATKQWVTVLREGMKYIPYEDVYSLALADPNRNFRQSIDYNGARLAGQSVKLNRKPGNLVVDGEAALLSIMAHFGTGGLHRIPLWNSGFWVSFKPATEPELIDLNNQLASDKIEQGRWSYGMALSNMVVYYTDRILDFAIAHAYSTSVRSDEMPIAKIRDFLKPQDIPSFILGFLCANYPTGFKYERACIHNPDKCNRVESATLNLRWLQHTDNRALEDWQRKHMSSFSTNSRTLEQVLSYQDKLTAQADRRVIFNAGTQQEMAITLTTPTTQEYIDQGHQWLSNIVKGVETALTTDATLNERNSMVNAHSRAAALNQHIHWVKKIELGEITQDPNAMGEPAITVVEDRKSIELQLQSLSAIDSQRELVSEAIIKYINDSTLSVIAVPSYDCPSCTEPQEGTGTELPVHVIPIDILQVFSGLLNQRISRILTR